MTVQIDADSRLAIEDRLREIDGIKQAVIDSRSGEVWIVRDPGHEQAPIEFAVRESIAALGHDPDSMPVHVSLAAAAGPRRRVRFVDAARSEGHDGVTVTVGLQWKDKTFQASVTGDRGPALELKTAAQAALDAIEAVAEQPLGLRIIGVKQVHAFDSDLMVVSLLKTDGPHQRLVGAVLVVDDPLAATALAVLSALNRTLGNFIHTAD